MSALAPLLQDLRDEQADLAGLVRGADLRTATPAQGWDVGDAVAHLHGTDLEATKAATRPEQFLTELPSIAQDVEGFLQGQLDEGRALGEALLRRWHQAFDAMVEAFAQLSVGTKVPGTARP